MFREQRSSRQELPVSPHLREFVPQATGATENRRVCVLSLLSSVGAAPAACERYCRSVRLPRLWRSLVSVTVGPSFQGCF